jgi:proteasome lid subunit RPN8/RPN11
MSPPRASTAVSLAPATLRVIRAEAARAYPREGCGALLGPQPGEVTDTLPLPNAEIEMPRTRFTISPLDYLAAEQGAEARGLRLLGFWHSHPDHPARPSPTDREYAWEGLLTVVIAVARGRPGEVTAWEVPGPGRPFQQLALVMPPE